MILKRIPKDAWKDTNTGHRTPLMLLFGAQHNREIIRAFLTHINESYANDPSFIESLWRNKTTDDCNAFSAWYVL